MLPWRRARGLTRHVTDDAFTWTATLGTVLTVQTVTVLQGIAEQMQSYMICVQGQGTFF